MIAGLERFVTELRRLGVSASPAEWLDALRAIEHVGLADRERFRVALSSALVKRSGERPVFEALFERFFAPPARGARAGERGRGAGAAAAGGAAHGKGSPRTGAPRPRRSPPERRAGPAAQRDVLPAHEILEQERLRERLSRARASQGDRRGRLRRVVVEVLRGADRTAAPRRDLARSWTVAEEREMASCVPRLVERIRLGTGRRLARSRRGRLYLRQVFRDNLAGDGVPFVLPRRRRRPRRSRIVLLVDVSWSTARAAGLFLSVAGEFLRRASDTRVLFFVDRAVDATAAVLRWLERELQLTAEPASARGRPRPGAGIVRGGSSFAQLLDALPELDLAAPSDYGRAFHALLRSRLRPSGRRTLLLVLGDGRSNRFDAQDWAFEEIAARCGAVLWLVPEPLERWGTGDSALADYLAHVDTAVEARDLAGLGRGVTELLRRL